MNVLETILCFDFYTVKNLYFKVVKVERLQAHLFIPIFMTKCYINFCIDTIGINNLQNSCFTKL